MSDKWWEAAPLAEDQPSGNWWEAAPLAEDQETESGGFLQTADDVVRSIAKGATFGFADEAAAAIEAVPALFDDREWSDLYDQGLARERQATGQAEERLGPVGSTIAEGAGAIAGVVGPTKALKLAGVRVPAVVAPGRGLLKNTVTAAGSGAALSGVYGFGTGEGGFENRLENAEELAKWGGAFGAVSPTAAKVVGKVAGKGADMVRRAVGRGRSAEDAALAKLASAAAEDGLDSAEAVRRELRGLGDQAAPIDLGRATQRTARGARTVDREAGNQIDDFLRARQEGSDTVKSQGARVIEAVERALPRSSDASTSIADNIARRQTRAKRLYDRAYPVMVDVNADIAQVLNTPAGQRAIRRAQQKIGNEMTVYAQPIEQTANGGLRMSTQFLDLVKRSLDDVTGAAQRSGKNDEVRLMSELSKRLRGAVDDQNSIYKNARAAYAEPTKLIEAAELGQKFLREEAKVTRGMLRKMSPEERREFRVGAADALIAEIKRQKLSANAAKNLIDRVSRQEQIKAIFPGRETRERFISRMRAEARKGETRGAVTGNSQTADKAADALSVWQALKAGPINAMQTAAEKAAASFLKEQTGARARELSKILTTDNFDAVADKLQRAYDRQAAQEAFEALLGNTAVITSAQTID